MGRTKRRNSRVHGKTRGRKTKAGFFFRKKNQWKRRTAAEKHAINIKFAKQLNKNINDQYQLDKPYNSPYVSPVTHTPINTPIISPRPISPMKQRLTDLWKERRNRHNTRKKAHHARSHHARSHLSRRTPLQHLTSERKQQLRKEFAKTARRRRELATQILSSPNTRKHKTKAGKHNKSLNHKQLQLKKQILRAEIAKALKLNERVAKRKSPKRKSPKRKSPKRKSPKRKSPKRKS